MDVACGSQSSSVVRAVALGKAFEVDQLFVANDSGLSALFYKDGVLPISDSIVDDIVAGKTNVGCPSWSLTWDQFRFSHNGFHLLFWPQQAQLPLGNGMFNTLMSEAQGGAHAKVASIMIHQKRVETAARKEKDISCIRTILQSQGGHEVATLSGNSVSTSTKKRRKAGPLI